MESSSETVETRIESLAAGGDGVGRLPDGRALFVPLTAPGDRVRVRVVESESRFARATLVDVIEPSLDRVVPACGSFGVCGGCAWQHLDYDAQVSAKAKILRDALVRIGHIDIDYEISVTPSPQAYAYRNRARLLQQGDKVGYRMRKSHQVCAVDRCPVLAPPLEGALMQLAGAPRRRERRRSVVTEWEIASGTDGETTTARVTGDRSPHGSVTMRVGEDQVRISRGVFAQGNGLLLEALVESVGRAAGSGTSLVELFAGAGLLTLELARRFDCVWALESNRGAVADLRFNLAKAGTTNVDVRPGRVEQTLHKLQVREPDVVVLDPPRTGLPKEALEHLAGLRAKRIAYLSCDPATLARDLARFRTMGYRLGAVEGFDLFPQTPHVEALATLDLI